MDKLYEAPRGRLLPTVVLFVFVLAVLYTLFMLFQQYSLNRGIDKVNEQIGEIELSIESMRGDQIEELFVAQELSDKVRGEMIYWSKVIKELQDLTPVTVFFSSYNAGEDGSIQLSGLGNSYGSVADAITVLDESDDFGTVFVPSATLGTTSDGQEVVSFSLQVKSNIK
jgi:hypothetical protein